MAREVAVPAKVLACGFVLLAFLALHALADITYRDDGPISVDDNRYGNQPCSHEYYFKVEYKNVTRLCRTKPIATVNGMFPGPPVYVREGDTVIVHVQNNIDYNLTLHWHGLRQLLQNWQDGPAYFTQCPIQPGHNFTYNFTITDQKRGTVWWHAHITWLRATLYGPLIILPRKGQVYPFKQPQAESTLLFGEWWNGDTQAIEADAVRTGAGYNVSDALTLNGQPGDLYNCSAPETTVVKVEAGRTYLLRLINSAMNFELYFGIKDHKLVVVEADGEYTKPYSSEVVLLTPGQTMNVLLKANKKVGGRYYIATSVWTPAALPFPGVSATAILEYTTNSSSPVSDLPQFPATNDSQWALDFEESIRSVNSKLYPAEVPLTINESLLYTVGYNFLECRPDQGCGQANGTRRIALTINNNTFAVPRNHSILEAYFNGINNVYTPDFPDNPPFFWNFTGPNPPNNTLGVNSTRVNVLKYGTNVQLTFQNTNILFFESHPFHLHGFSFYVVGSGFGNFNAAEDTKNFNLEDPPLRNTISIPAGGWTTIRWKASNPGVWLMHCHLEIHQAWGMSTAFIVLDGEGPNEKLPPPPPNMPQC